MPTVSKTPNKRQSKNGEEVDAETKTQVKGEESRLPPAFKSLRLREKQRVPQQQQQQVANLISSHQQKLQQQQNQNYEQQQPMLTLNPVNGRVTDESTGKTYVLKPVKVWELKDVLQMRILFIVDSW